MPYTPPAGEPRTRNHKRSFTDEHGNNAFAPLPSLPRRVSKPATTTTLKSPAHPISIQIQSPSTSQKKFQFKDDDDDDEDDDQTQVVQIQDSIPFPSIVSPTPRHESNGLPRSVSVPAIPSPSPQDTPSIYRSPYSSTRASPNSRTLRPLKPSLKSNHSSPHLPSLGSPHPRTVAQSAPTTPHNLPSNITPSGQNSPEHDSPRTPSSALPQTPKQVHFAAEKSSLESIVVFAKTARPRSLSTGHDTETETEGYDSSSNTWGTWSTSRYPFPVMPKTEESIVILDDSKTSPIPASAGIGSGGMHNGEKAMVYLETLTLPSTKPPALRGSVLVRNVAFQKRVAVRFTLDDWQTTSEVSCPYSDSLPSLPPPFSALSHSSNPLGLSLDGSNGNSTPLNTSQPTTTTAKFSMGGKQDSWDRFTFVIKLGDVERSLVNKRLYLVVRYTVPSQWGFESGGEWWDNNLTRNYEVGFKAGKRSTIGAGSAAPSTPASAPATTSSSGLSSAARNASLPPLPPPGPIKPSATAGGLKLKPKLAPISLDNDEHPPVQLRQGRGPTFVEARSVESPPGSPRKAESPITTYTPPMPGALPISPSSSLTNVRDALGPSASTTPTPSMYAEKPATAGYASKSPGLSISTGVQPVTVPAGGKKRLSLSNYASPIKPVSTSPTTTPAASRPSSTYSTASSTSPVTPYDGGLGLKIVGGMPATIIDANGNLSDGMRVPSWEDATAAAAMWYSNSEAGLKGGEDKKDGASKVGDLLDAVQQPLLPTPPDSGADSNNSTPDLELSPEVSINEVDGQEEQPKSVAPGRKLSSPPPKKKNEEGDLSPSSSSSTVRLSSPTPSTRGSGLSASRPAHKASFTTSASSQSSSSSSTSESEAEDDPWNIIRPPAPEKQMTNLDKRVNQGRMRLDLPSRPAWKTPTAATPPTMASAIPPAKSFGLGSRSNSLDAVNLASAGTATSRSPGKRNPSTLGTSETSSTTPLRTGSVDGLSSMGGSGSGGAFNGPPPEFLAKYCFFVSSPTTTPSPPVPVGGGNVNGGGSRGGHHSRGVSDSTGVLNKRTGYSPNTINGAAIPISSSPGSGSMYAMGLGMSPPGQGAAFTPTGAFAGIDTPRASSPGLNDGSSNWWAFGGAQKVIS